jgi:hypothetical protein
VRRLQLASHPDLLALPFLMLNRGDEKEGALHSGRSNKDNLWAVETPVPQGAESPIDVLLPAHSSGDADDAVVEAFWAHLCSEAPSRKLGQANVLVARSLFAPDTLLDGEAEAASELQATGWALRSRGWTAASRARACCFARRASTRSSSLRRARRHCGLRRSPRASPRAQPPPLRGGENGAMMRLFFSRWCERK